MKEFLKFVHICESYEASCVCPVYFDTQCRIAVKKEAGYSRRLQQQWLILTITRKMFQIKNPGRLEARHDVEKAGCLCLEFW